MPGIKPVIVPESIPKNMNKIISINIKEFIFSY